MLVDGYLVLVVVLIFRVPLILHNLIERTPFLMRVVIPVDLRMPQNTLENVFFANDIAVRYISVLIVFKMAFVVLSIELQNHLVHG